MNLPSETKVVLSEQDESIYSNLYYSDEEDSQFGLDNMVYKLACKGGHLQIVKYQLTKDRYRATIDFDKNIGFRVACENGKVHIIDYLLNYAIDKEKVDIYHLNDISFYLTLVNKKKSSLKKRIKVLKYLMAVNKLNSPEEIKINEDRFILICKNNNEELINYCIYELKIPQSDYLSKNLNDLGSIINNHISNLLSNRDLHALLHEKLENKQDRRSKIKI